MNRVFLVLILLSLSSVAFSQKMIVLTNPVKNKVIEVHPGQSLSLKYRGYLGQTEFAKNVVSDITDSTVCLGLDPATLGEALKGSSFLLKNYKVVRISDIIAFRRMSAGRQLLKSFATIGAVLGTYFIFNDKGLLLPLGVGLGAKLLIDVALPENPKHKMSDGWNIRVVEMP